MKQVTILLIFLFAIKIYSIDDGSVEVEYSFGKVNFTDLSENLKEESFLYLSHNYLYFIKNHYFSFRSQLGVSRSLFIQDAQSTSYKNIITGIVPGFKYKYLKGIWNFIPEIFLGVSLNVISLWNEKDENNLIFFTGINLGGGVSYIISDGFRLGLKLMYDIGYGNFMNKSRNRFTASVFTVMFSLDFYEE